MRRRIKNDIQGIRLPAPECCRRRALAPPSVSKVPKRRFCTLTCEGCGKFILYTFDDADSPAYGGTFSFRDDAITAAKQALTQKETTWVSGAK